MSDVVAIVIDDVSLLDQPPGSGNASGWFSATTDAIEGGWPSDYNNTNFTPEFTAFGKEAWVFSFDGTSVSYFGITPPSGFNQTFGISATPFDSVNLQSQLAEYAKHTYIHPAYGGQFYSTPVLSNAGQIEVGLTGARGLAIDYAVVTVGDSTNLQGQTIIVDDTSTELSWTGSWTAKNNFTLPVPCQLGFSPRSEDFFSFTANMAPHANTTHASDTPGDSFEFRFAGTSILVSGVTPGNDSGTSWFLTMEFTLDGKTTTKNFTQDLNYVSKPHFTYFNMSQIDAGNHTLVGKIVTAAGSVAPAAQIDYITYEPSFLTARDKPEFGASGGSPSQSSSASSSASAVTLSSPSPLGVNHSKATGAIAGGVIGGLCFLGLLCAALLWFMHRGRRKNGAQSHPEIVREPFLSQASSPGDRSIEKRLFPSSTPSTGPSSSEPEFSPYGYRAASIPTELDPHSQNNQHGNSNSPGPSALDVAPIVQQQDNLPSRIPHLNPTYSEVAASGHGARALEERVRELQTEMQNLRREVQHNALPPAYDGGD